MTWPNGMAAKANIRVVAYKLLRIVEVRMAISLV
jgi:hypothetical protein